MFRSSLESSRCVAFEWLIGTQPIMKREVGAGVSKRAGHQQFLPVFAGLLATDSPISEFDRLTPESAMASFRHCVQVVCGAPALGA